MCDAGFKANDANSLQQPPPTMLAWKHERQLGSELTLMDEKGIICWAEFPHVH